MTKDKKMERANQDGSHRLAPGLDGVEGLDREATAQEIARQDFTQVTKLEYDEYDASDVRD